MHPRCKVSTVSNVIKASKSLLLGATLACFAADASQIAVAQKAPEAASMPVFAPAMIDHARNMRRYKDPDHGVQHTPPIINRFIVDRDPKGAIASFQPNARRSHRTTRSSRIWERMAELASPAISRRTAGA